MTARTRKLIGAVVLLVWVIVYALLAMVVAVILQVNGGVVTEVAYYVVAGLAWVPPAMFVVWWMQRPDAPGA